jgi:D-sedoheptulose 7-phosphate isomerase
MEGESDTVKNEIASGQSPPGDSHDGEVMQRTLSHRCAVLSEGLAELEKRGPELGRAAALLVATLRGGHKIMLAGNGGSAAEAQHFSAELVGRFRRERPAYAAIALTTDTSILTAIGNDYSYDDVFSRQVEGLGRSGDVLVAFTTSGNSENLVRAATTARERGVTVIAITGAHPSRLEEAADLTVRAPGADTPAVQELHTVITHVLCDIVEGELF